MNKTELIADFAGSMSMTAAESARCVDKMFDLVQRALVAGDDVTLPGIGSLKVKPCAARKARNPQTGEALDIPAKKKLAIVMGKHMRAALNG